jgi:anhydro-N-acetylmuramic acid kinase|tara:strand:- start:198 stop:1319 length:1122 start_codon:yes stop_codon:yes gene_type:complete
MQKNYTSLGLMSGTSGDGVDASIIHSNGVDQYEVIKDKYFEYDSNIYEFIHSLKDKIFNINDLTKHSVEILDLERKITIFHAKIIKELEFNNEDILVGFHGQTIYHNSKEKVSKQLGDGKLLHQLTKKKIIFNFRKNDILNGGEGAPLAPLFHQLIATQKNILLPVCFLNIGGISNITIIKKPIGSLEVFSKDIGPGNCLIDTWVRKNSNKKFDNNGEFASSGKKNVIIFEQAQELYSNRMNKEKLSFDTSDFDISFIRGLSLEDGAATLTDFTSSIIGNEISSVFLKFNNKIKEILICGGGRKNKVLIKKIKENLSQDINLKQIDDYKINGDFIESQAFAFLAIRSILNLPISFPNTTGCTKPCLGGELIKN